MADGGTLLIRAGRVFPACDETVLEDAWVLVEDGRIAEVSASEPRATGARRIEQVDATLLPGLIDCHVHLTLGGSGDWLGEANAPGSRSCFATDPPAVAAGHADHLVGRQDLRALHQAGPDLVAQQDLDPVASAERPNGGEAAPQGGHGALSCLPARDRGRLVGLAQPIAAAAEREVNVAVDQPGQQRRVGLCDTACARRAGL